MDSEVTNDEISNAITKQLESLQGYSDNDVAQYVKDNIQSKIQDRDTFNEVVVELVHSDERIRDNIIDKFITNQDLLLSTGRYSVRQYLDACKYVSFSMMGIHPIDAWKFTFPERYNKLYKKWKKTGITDETIRGKIHTRVNSYKNGNLVTSVVQRSHTPLYIHNSNIAQNAISRLDTLMNESQSERIQMESAKTLLEYLQPPKELLIKQDVTHTMKDDEGTVSKLTTMLAELSAVGQQKMKDDGLTVQAIDVKIVDNE